MPPLPGTPPLNHTARRFHWRRPLLGLDPRPKRWSTWGARIQVPSSPGPTSIRRDLRYGVLFEMPVCLGPGLPQFQVRDYQLYFAVSSVFSFLLTITIPVPPRTTLLFFDTPDPSPEVSSSVWPLPSYRFFRSFTLGFEYATSPSAGPPLVRPHRRDVPF